MSAGLEEFVCVLKTSVLDFILLCHSLLFKDWNSCLHILYSRQHASHSSPTCPLSSPIKWSMICMPSVSKRLHLFSFESSDTVARVSETAIMQPWMRQIEEMMQAPFENLPPGLWSHTVCENICQKQFWKELPIVSASLWAMKSLHCDSHVHLGARWRLERLL